MPYINTEKGFVLTMDNEEPKTKKPQLIAKFGLEEYPEKKTFDVDLVGLPGFRQQLFLHFYSPDLNHPLHSDDPEGLPGKYKVIFTLNRPGFSLLPDDSYADAASLQGASHLAIAKPAHPHPNLPENTHIKIASEIAGEEFTFDCYPNEKGFLAKIVLESIEATNYGDAALRAFRGVTFALSSMSFRYDIPLNIYQVDVIESRTGRVRISIVRAFREIPFMGDPTRLLNQEFLKYASYYREGLNSNNVSYQFLCFYKIIEGLRDRRERLIREAKAKGQPILTPLSQRIPKERNEQVEWLNSILFIQQSWDDMSLISIFPKEALGRTIGNLIDKKSELHKMRLKIAHAVLDSGEPTLSIDDAFDIEHVNKWLPLTKYIARYLLSKEFPDRFPDEAPKPGKVKLYRSRRFTARPVGDHMEYDPEPESLEHVQDISTEIRDGKVSMPSISLNMESEGFGIDSDGNPNVIYIGMEVHEDGSEHHLFTGYYHPPSNTFCMYGVRK